MQLDSSSSVARELRMRIPAEFFDDQEDAGELLDSLVGNAEAEEATKAKLKELDRLAECGVYQTVDLRVALQKNRITTRWEVDDRKNRTRARFVTKEFKGDETIKDVFAPEHGMRHRLLEPQEVITHIQSKRDQRVLPRGRRRRMLRGPTARTVGTTGRTGEFDLCAMATAKQLYGRRRAGTRWADFMVERLGVSIDVKHHNSLQIMSWMFSLRYTWMIYMAPHRDPRRIWSTNLSQKIRFKIWTVNDSAKPILVDGIVAQHRADELQTSTNAERWPTWTCKSAAITVDCWEPAALVN